MASNPIQQKSYAFALNIVSLCRELVDLREYVISKQLIKSGTSVGANVEEALQAQSKADFISKLSISLKEACETDYWLRLLRDSKTCTDERINPLLAEIKEIEKLLTAIIKTSKKNQR